jgi:phosphohistidine swiveling domain-containing protein
MQINNKNWTFVYSEGHSMLLNEVWFRAFTNYPKVPGIFKEMLYVNKEGLEVCYAPESEIKRVREQGKIFFSESYRKKFKKDIYKHANIFANFWKDYNKINFSKLTNKQLLRIFNKYVKYLEPLLAYYQVSGGRTYPLLEEFVKDKMASDFKENKLEEAYSTILTSTDLDLMEKEEIDLLKLSDRKIVTEDNLLLHAKNYAYSYLCTYDQKQVLISLKERLSELKKKYRNSRIFLAERLKKKSDLLKVQKKIIKKFSNDKKLLSLIEFLRNQGKLRFDYKEWFFGAEYKFLNIFIEVAKRLELPLQEYMDSYQIIDTQNFLKFNRKLSQGEINKRCKIFVFLQLAGKKYFYSGDKASQVEKQAFPVSDNSKREVRGVTANAGVVTGRARIILPKNFSHLQEAMKEFKAGEILITTMTQPNLLVIMRKSVAIITNQGGITSHAAVLSRELGVPCVVGTLIATEVFKTGDLIKVDADKGVITLIK